MDSLAGMTPLCEDHHTCSSTPPPPFQGPVIGFPSVTAPPLPSHGTVFSSTAPVCLPPPASDGTPIHYLFLILCFSTSFPSNANWTRKVNEQLPGTYSIAGRQTEVISGLIRCPISQMRETEAQRGKLAFLARVTELGSDPRNIYSRNQSLPHLLGVCLSCFLIVL